MDDNELPLGRRAWGYRFFEMLPALLSFGLPIALIVISFIDPLLGAWFVLFFIGLTLCRGVRGGVDSIRGYRRMRRAEAIDWSALNAEVELVLRRSRGETDTDALPVTGAVSLAGRGSSPDRFGRRHLDLLADAATSPEAYPLPSQLVHAVIVTAYNESYEVIEPSIEALAAARIGAERLVVMFAYEERGGAQMRLTAQRLKREYGELFRAFELVEHPAELPDEIPGKGANLTFAGRYLQSWLDEQGIAYRDVIVTSLDCDNRPHPGYFDYVSYEYVRHLDRERISLQPVSLFVNNVWYAPAPMRVIASGNSLWNLISTTRSLSLRNFASHAQPMSALVSMDFWSRRTIVEDGHQYWRSYFHFRGRYRVIPVHVPIYQDAVLAENLPRTLRAQFKQLARWAYGASDVPYVAVRLFNRKRSTPFWPLAVRFAQLLESHVSLASVAPMVAVGAWLPLLVAHADAWIRETVFAATERMPLFLTPRYEGLGSRWGLGVYSINSPDAFVQALPGIVDLVERFAIAGALVSVVLSLLLLPRRPREFGPARSFAMVAQWVLLPLTVLGYNTMTALYSQSRLLVGAYRERFDVTEKTAPEALRASAAPQAQTRIS